MLTDLQRSPRDLQASDVSMLCSLLTAQTIVSLLADRVRRRQGKSCWAGDGIRKLDRLEEVVGTIQGDCPGNRHSLRHLHTTPGYHRERVSLCHSLPAEQQCGGTIEKQGSGSSVGVEQEATSTWPKVPGIPLGCLPVKRVECVRCIDKQNIPTFAFVFVEEVVHRVDRRFNASFQTGAKLIWTAGLSDVIPGNHHHRLCHASPGEDTLRCLLVWRPDILSSAIRRLERRVWRALKSLPLLLLWLLSGEWRSQKYENGYRTKICNFTVTEREREAAGVFFKASLWPEIGLLTKITFWSLLKVPFKTDPIFSWKPCEKFSGEVGIKCHQSCLVALVFCSKSCIKLAVSLCSFSQFSFPFNFPTANALVLKFGPLPLSDLFSKNC